MSRNSDPVLFEEEQRFTQIWFWVLILATSLFLTYGFFQQVLLGKEFGSQDANDILFTIVWVLIGLGLPLLAFKTKLVTRVYEDRIAVRFYPFHQSANVYRINHLEKMEVVKYQPLLEYGGWGVRYSHKGKAYNVKGNRGLKLWFRSGRPLLIGTQKPEELRKAIEQVR